MFYLTDHDRKKITLQVCYNYIYYDFYVRFDKNYGKTPDSVITSANNVYKAICKMMLPNNEKKN